MNLKLTAIALLGTLSAWGHHSFQAEFDDKKIMTLKGTVTKFEWTNPHSYIFMDVADPSGKVVNWGIESHNLSILTRRGWNKNTLQPGEEISVLFFRHKDPEKNKGFARTITKADGTKLVILQRGEDAEANLTRGKGKE